jgi:hypothetical protein
MPDLDLFILIDDASSQRAWDPTSGTLRAFVQCAASDNVGRSGLYEKRHRSDRAEPDHRPCGGCQSASTAGRQRGCVWKPVSFRDRSHERVGRRGRTVVRCVMVTDGIDRAHRGGRRWRGLSNNPDVDSASAVAMRTGTTIHTIYAPGSGRQRRNHWAAHEWTDGALPGFQTSPGASPSSSDCNSPVRLQTVPGRVLQKTLDNRYLVELFCTNRARKPGLQPVTLSTESCGC